MTPQHVANFFLDKSFTEDKYPISTMKLIKLVYIGYGWVAAALNEPLFEEDIEAWKQGPAIASLYHEFKHFGKHTITHNSVTADVFFGFSGEEGQEIASTETEIPRIDKSEKKS